MSNIGNKETFSRNLTYYVEHSGKTQKLIAEDLGIARSVFNEWLKGKKYPRIDKIEMLADYFGLKKSDLIEERGWEEKKEKDADLFNRVKMDKELTELIRIYYSLPKREQRLIRNFINDLNQS